VRRSGDNVRITAQLIDAATDEHLWAETYDRELVDIFEIQAQVAGQITRALETRLSPVEEAIITAATPRNLEAFDLYTQARLAVYDLGWTSATDEHRLHTIGLLERAVAIDPEFSEAWQLLSRTKCFLVFHDRDPDGELLAEADYALSRARELAPDTTETIAAETIFHYQCKRELEPALQMMRQVRAREPKRAEWAFIESWILRRLGRWDEMLASMGQAVRLDPLNPGPVRIYAISLRDLGRYEEAYQAELLFRRLEPGRWDDLILGMDRIMARPDYGEWTALMEYELGRLEESDIPIVPPEMAVTEGFALLVHLFLTDRGAEAWRLLGRAPEEIVPGTLRDVSVAYYQMRILDFLGRSDEARELAAKALEAQVGLDDELVLFGNATFGGYLGDRAIAREGLAMLRREWTEALDPYLGRLALYRYIEALLLSDPALAKETYLAAPPELHFLGPGDFGADLVFWHRLLDYPEFRELLRDHPEWLRYVRERWPEGRPFPFDDAPEVLAREDD
jgi:tetratricopeptide (TPR) repeat protein